jgi:prepilin-type N-terminal cleavage/methylation domain-containing protein
MDRTQRGVHGQQGFSFIETLLAVAVIGLGLLAITSLFPTGYSNITYGGRTTSALALAQQKLEQLKAAAESEGFGGINTNPGRCPGTPETVADAVVPTVVYTRTCVLNNGVGVGSLAQDLKRVRVRVTWEWGAENRPGSVELEQLFTRTRP